jgi:hypothetical protein
MDNLLVGGLVVSCVVIGLFFFRFWKATRDPFFALFAAAFWLHGLQWLYSGITGSSNEYVPLAYLLRLAAYSLIVLAIVRKNMRGGSAARDQ